VLGLQGEEGGNVGGGGKKKKRNNEEKRTAQFGKEQQTKILDGGDHANARESPK